MPEADTAILSNYFFPIVFSPFCHDPFLVSGDLLKRSGTLCPAGRFKTDPLLRFLVEKKDFVRFYAEADGI